MVKGPDDRPLVQRDLDHMVCWVQANNMYFNISSSVLKKESQSCL